MSLTVAGIAALGVAASKGADTYFMGCDILGAELPATPKKEPIAVRDVRSPYWTSVGAGLTVAGILTVIGFTYAKLHHKRFSFAGALP